MPRKFCIFIYLFVLILNILDLKATESRKSETQIQLLTSTDDQNEKNNNMANNNNIRASSSNAQEDE